MKKLFLALTLTAATGLNALAGGLLTNTNQNVAFLRNPARDASTEIDAAYSNPAGLTLLNDGWHFSINSQSAWQTRTITADYTLPTGGQPFMLNGGSAIKTYKGKATAPIVPSLQAAYKTGNWAFSLNASIVCGGGKLKFDTGLPMFESLLAGAAALASQAAPLLGINGYSLDSQLEGSSMTYGIQLGASYKINDMFSAYLGGRLNLVRNGYEGYIHDYTINTTAVGPITQANAATYFSSSAALMKAFDPVDLDCKQNSAGFTPIIGVNIHEGNFNMGIRYEFKTKIDLKNDTKVNTSGIAGFDNGAKTPYDIPALFAAGISYKFFDCLTFSTAYHRFYDSNARMTNEVHKNIKGGTTEILAGIEWQIDKMFLVSAGMQNTTQGVKDEYQSDLNFSLNSNAYGFGGAVNLTKNLKLNVAYFWTVYKDWTKNWTIDSTTINQEVKSDYINRKFSRSNKTFGIGLDLKF